MKKANAKTKAARGTADQILDTAQRLVQTRGFNAFSYADISAALGITKASLHYHFASKASLGTSLIARYDAAMTQKLTGITNAVRNSRQELRDYAAIYR